MAGQGQPRLLTSVSIDNAYLQLCISNQWHCLSYLSVFQICCCFFATSAYIAKFNPEFGNVFDGADHHIGLRSQ